ncbi:MAG: serine/threonine-protein kinase [Cyanobacteriota bacterium]
MLQAKQLLQGRYYLQQSLGQNAGRQTWLAQEQLPTSQQQVIVKLLAFSPQMQWDEFKLFEREAQVLQNLNHPRLPKYRDYFSLDRDRGEGLCWFALVQDYIPGQSLQQLLDQGKHFTEEQVRSIATQVLEILIYLHGLNPPVLHRDIKPSNLIWGEDEQIYLVDFGAVQDPTAVEGATFTVVGTAGYAPLEQFYGKAVPASDLYALGASLIHLLTGTAPADLPQRNLRIQFRDRISLNPSFLRWIESLIEPDLERRFSWAAQALEALKTGHFFIPLVQISCKPAGSQIQLKKSPMQLAIKIPRQITSENVITFIVKLLGLVYSQIFLLLPILIIILTLIGLSRANFYGNLWGVMVTLGTFILHTWIVSIPIIVLLVYPWIGFCTALKQLMLGCFGNQAIYFTIKQLVTERQLFSLFRSAHRPICQITEIKNIQYIFGEGVAIQINNQKHVFKGLTKAEGDWLVEEIQNWLETIKN